MIEFDPAELEGIEVWTEPTGGGQNFLFCRVCYEECGAVPLQLLTAITLALEHVRSVHRGAPHSTCVEVTGLGSGAPRGFLCGAGCPDGPSSTCDRTNDEFSCERSPGHEGCHSGASASGKWRFWWDS